MKLYLCLLLSILLSAVVLAAPASYHQVKRIAVGGDGGWDYLTVDSAAHILYVGRSTRTIAIDVVKGVVAGEVANTPGVHGIALAPKLHRGFTSNGKDNTVTVFDLKTYKEIARVPVGTNPDAILFDPASNRVFTMNGGSNDATAIDAASLKVVGTMALGGRPEYAVADEKGAVYVNIEDKNEIVALDARTLALKNRWSIAPGDSPTGLTMDRKHRRLFAVCGNAMMIVMNADTGAVVATPAIGNGPDAVAFDPGTGLVFSSNGRDGTLTVLKEETPDKYTVLATVPTQMGSRTMALDPKTHTIYLAAARFKAAAADPEQPHQRPQMEPGSFEILVFGK